MARRAKTPPTRAAAAHSKEEVLERLFAPYADALPHPSTLPEVVLRNRRARARQRLIQALDSGDARTDYPKLAEELAELVRGWAAHDFIDGYAAAERFEIRCAEEAERRSAEQAGTDDAAVRERQYRRLVVERYGSIEIRGLQVSERVRQDLEMAYVPLRLADPSQARTVKVGKGMELREVPRLEVEAVLARHACVLIVGEPGSGKTTLMAYLAARLAEGKLGDIGAREALLPLVVPVRSLRAPRLDIESLSVAAECPRELVERSLVDGQALVLLDGIDEAMGATTGPLIEALETFVREHPRVRVVATSRPAGLPGGEETQLAGFATVQLLPLTREEIDVFIERWCRAAERSVQKDAHKADEDARRAADDLKRRVHTSPPVERLAETPLVATILCVVHRFLGQRIPERRAALYEACTNVLLYEWDRAKFPEGAAIGRLDAQQKKYLLGDLARWMHERRTAEVAEAELVERFEAKLPSLGQRREEAREVVVEIRDRSGILVERRPGVFGFSHLTFQEYLTALEVARSGETKALAGRWEDSWWHEVIVLAAGLPGVDAAGLVEALLAVDEEHIGPATLLAAQCLETAIELPRQLRENVQKVIRIRLPPRNNSDVDLVVLLGSLTAPLLLRELESANPTEKAFTALALAELRHEAACATLARLYEHPHAEQRIIRSGYIDMGGHRINFNLVRARDIIGMAIAKLAVEGSAIAVATLQGLAAKTPMLRRDLNFAAVLLEYHRDPRLRNLMTRGVWSKDETNPDPPFRRSSSRSKPAARSR